MQTSEYVSSFQNNNAIPNHGFDAISHEIKFLAIEDSLEGKFRKLQPCLQRLIFIELFQKTTIYQPLKWSSQKKLSLPLMR
jgi:DNA mismatch repair protein MutS2